MITKSAASLLAAPFGWQRRPDWGLDRPRRETPAATEFSGGTPVMDSLAVRCAASSPAPQSVIRRTFAAAKLIYRCRPLPIATRRTVDPRPNPPCLDSIHDERSGT